MSESKTELFYYDVFNIQERPGQKPFWFKIGRAFVNKDDSINIKLNAIPIGTDLQLREHVNNEDLTKNIETDTNFDDDVPF